MIKEIVDSVSGSYSKLKLPPSYLDTIRALTNSLQEDEPHLDFLFDSFPDLICLSDKKYFLKINASKWKEILGHDEIDLYSSPITSFIHPNDKIADKKSSKHFNRFRHRNGLWIPLCWSTSEWTDGRILGTARTVSNTCSCHLEESA